MKHLSNVSHIIRGWRKRRRKRIVSRFEQLNDDVLLLIIPEATRTQFGCLTALSTTCHRLRAISSSFLFHRVIINHAYSPFSLRDSDEFAVPRSICAYIKTLSFKGYMPVDESKIDMRSLISVLPAMTNLSTVSFEDIPRGAPWKILSAIASVPSLRRVDILRSPWEFNNTHDVDNSTVAAQVPLEEFTFTSHDWRDFICWEEDMDVWDIGQEESRVLGLLLVRMCTSLQVLRLQSESAPYSRLITLSWTHLHELSLVGRFSLFNERFPIHSILVAMPNLRILHLKLSRVKGQEQQVVLPKHTDLGSHTIIPHLEDFTLTYPDTEDAIFDHIRPNLRRLSLRDWMRHYNFLDSVINPGRWSMASPIPSSSSLLAILRRFSSPELEQLEIIYQTDGDDMHLMQFIATAYPLLTKLEIHRYRGTGSGPIEANIFAPLSTLRHLREVRAYFEPIHGFHPHALWLDIPQAFLDELDDYVAAFARALYPQLRTVAFLVRHESSNYWWTWDVDYTPEDPQAYSVSFVEDSRRKDEYSDGVRAPIMT
ncbi:hypothetical protein OF83DRAFT_1134299 [Amylostereum chailletii]|nr:hypothetical protein OF83DRAFT_1134299 [Amylostereum chailletii]